MFASQIKFNLDDRDDHRSNEQYEVFELEARCSQCEKLALIFKFLKTSALCLSFVSMSPLVGVAQVFQKSDILLSYPQTKSIRDKYSASGIAWGVLPIPPHWDIENRDHFNFFTQNIRTISNEGRTFHARIEFDAGWELFIDYCLRNGLTYTDYACKSIDDQNFEYPWFAGRSYKEGRPYWLSSHSAVFKDFLKYQIDKALLADHLKVLMLDAQTSSALACRDQWSSGDFSKASVTAFSSWLQQECAPDELNALGIQDIQTFDYRRFLKQHGVHTDADYKNRVQQHVSNGTQLPLYEEFRLFQNAAIRELTADLIAYARDQADPRGILVGTSSPLGDPYRSTLLEELDFYQQELAMEESDFAHKPAFTYKFAESLDTHFILTAEPSDWECINRDKSHEPEVKQWIAEAYAQGAVFIAPAEQWTIKSGNYTPTLDFTSLYKWISENKSLFNDFTDTQAEVALVVSREATRKYVYRINSIVHALEEANVAFDVLVAGDDYFKNPVSFNTLDQYKKVLVQEDEYNWFISKNVSLKNSLDLLGDKLYRVGTHNGDGQTQTIDLRNLKKSLDYTVSCSAHGVRLYPRISSTQPNSMVVHVVNTNYDNTHQLVVQKGLRLNLKNSGYSKATFYQAGEAPIQLTVTATGNNLEVSGIDSLDSWGVVLLKNGFESNP